MTEPKQLPTVAAPTSLPVSVTGWLNDLEAGTEYPSPRPKSLSDREAGEVRREAERLARLLEGKLTRDLVAAELARISVHVQPPQFPGEAAKRMWLDDWFDALAEFAPAVVRQAFMAHQRESTFFPKLAEIVKRCAAETDRTLARRYRLDALAREHTARTQPDAGEPLPLAFKGKRPEPIAVRTEREFRVWLEKYRAAKAAEEAAKAEAAE